MYGQVGPPPPCFPPVNIIATAVTHTSAIFSWTELEGATAWEVLILPAGAPSPGLSDASGSPSVQPLTPLPVWSAEPSMIFISPTSPIAQGRHSAAGLMRLPRPAAWADNPQIFTAVQRTASAVSICARMNPSWFFEGINLPPAIENPQQSQGQVMFKVKPKPGYAAGDVIPNQASIYFDFNLPLLPTRSKRILSMCCRPKLLRLKNGFVIRARQMTV